VWTIYFGVVKRFRKTNISVGGYNLTKDGCPKSGGHYTVIKLYKRTMLSGGQREKFKFRAEKRFEKNNLERSKDGERKEDQGKKNCETKEGDIAF